MQTHLWPIVIDCDLYVVVRVLTRQQVLQSRVDRYEKLARLASVIVLTCPAVGALWVLDYGDTATLEDGRVSAVLCILTHCRRLVAIVDVGL